MKIRISDMLKNKSQKLNTPMNSLLFSKIKTNDEYKLFWKALNFESKCSYFEHNSFSNLNFTAILYDSFNRVLFF